MQPFGSSLLRASSDARAQAQAKSRARNWLHYGVAAMAVATALLEPSIAWPLVLFACVLQVLALFLKLRATDQHYLSRSAQRLALLSDALGREIGAFDIVEILRTGQIDHVRLPYKYYTTHARPGLGRLAINIAESSFFSRHLLEAHERRTRILIIIFGFVFGLALVILLTAWTSPQRGVLIVAAGVLALILLDDIETLVTVRRAIRLLEKTDGRLDSVIYRMFDAEHVLATFADYVVASSLAPPVPSDIYRAQREKLTSLWEMRRKAYEAALETRHHDSYDDGILRTPRGTIRMFEDRGALPAALSEANRSTIMRVLFGTLPADARVDSIEITRIQAGSAATVCDFRMRLNEAVVGRCVVKVYRDPKDAGRERQRLARFASLSTEFFPRLIEDPSLLAVGAVGCYHMNYAEATRFESANHAMFRAFLADDWAAAYGDRGPKELLRSARIVGEVLGRGLGDPSDIERAAMLFAAAQGEPCDTIVDVRSANWTIESNVVRIMNGTPSNPFRGKAGPGQTICRLSF